MRLLILIVLIVYSSAFSQKLFIEEINSDELPLSSAKIYAFTDDKTPALSLDISDFNVIDDLGELSVTSYSNPTQNLYSNSTIAIYVDLNLFEEDSANVKAIIRNTVNSFDLSENHIYLIGYDKLNYLYYDSQNPFHDLENAINLFESEFYTNPWESLTKPDLNPIDLLINDPGENKQIVAVSNSALEVDNILEIADRANNNDITIHSFLFSKYDNISLRQLSESTNGFYWSGSDYELAELLIATKLRNYEASTLQWNISGACESNQSGTITMNFFDAEDEFNYFIPDSLKPRLSLNPANIELKNVLPFTTNGPNEIFINAVNSDITIYDISLENDYGGVFQISGEIDENTDPPKTLVPGGAGHGIQLNFTPQDSAIAFTRIVIKSDACFGNEIKILGGFPNVAPNEPTIKLLKPECGETLFAGSEYEVEWTGLLPQDIIQLEYSIDNGDTWDTLAKNVNGLRTKWRVPDVDTDEALVRAIQLWPNNIGQTLNLNHFEDNIAGNQLYEVNSAFFDSTGRYAVTASHDNLVRMWDTNTGEVLMSFVGHSDEVTWAVFSPNGSRIASCDRSGNAYLWYADPNGTFFGQPVVTYNGHNDQINSINFSPDGEQVITSCNDGRYRIFTTSTASLVHEGSNPGDSRVRFAVFSSDGNSYFVGGNVGLIYQIDRNTHSLIKTFDLRDEGSTTPRSLDHIAVSPDNKYLAVTSEIRKLCRVWNIETEEQVHNFYHYPYQFDNYNNRKKIYSAHFYFDEQDSVLITSGGFEAIRWDMVTGDSTAIFSEHDSSSTIRTANYNFDGSRVITSSWDGTAKIWNLTERDLQMDTTDCPFSIKSISAGGSDLTFTEPLVPGKVNSLTFTDAINNLSSSSFNIISGRVIGANRRSFRIQEDLQGMVLNDDIDLTIEFIPQKPGSNTAQLELIIPTDTIYLPLSGEAIAKNFINQIDAVNFGDIQLESIADALDQNIWLSQNSQPISIDSIKLFAPYPERFGLLDFSDISSEINDQETFTASLRYLPDTLKLDNAALKIYHSGEYKSEKVLLLGRGVPIIIDSVSFNFTDFEGNAGDQVTSSIILENITDEGIQNDISGFEFRIDFDASLLVPRFQADFDSIGLERRYLRFSLPFDKEIEYSDGDKFHDLNFTATLGKDSTTSLNVETITQIGDGKLILEYDDALFRLLDLCYEGGARLIDTYGRFTLEQNAPNPARNKTQINFEVIEKGQTRLLIYDMNGNLVDFALQDNLELGNHSIEINTSKYPAGNYFYILESPTLRNTRKMTIEN